MCASTTIQAAPQPGRLPAACLIAGGASSSSEGKEVAQQQQQQQHGPLSDAQLLRNALLGLLIALLLLPDVLHLQERQG